MVAGIEAVLSEAELDVLLYHVDGPATGRGSSSTYRHGARSMGWSSSPSASGPLTRLDRMRVSIVAIGDDGNPYPSVGIDEELAGRQAVEHLIGLGHRRIDLDDIATAHRYMENNQATGKLVVVP
jgi:LacI family repressor for deo operon, udp, cdd, tsx, nupC, and nupG